MPCVQRDKEYRNRDVNLEASSVARTYDSDRLEGRCYNVSCVVSSRNSPSLKSDRDSTISVPLSPEAPEVLTDLLEAASALVTGNKLLRVPHRYFGRLVDLPYLLS